ncbi:glycosyltransferase [Bradyrhizobium sp. CCBAU 21359]|uniref:glycosyltransferase n=1 Tax=Bradyrhizobium sp. CCBAU 21359 TaxID=1325080 RepID=UPI002305F94A|nr:glycosyltransferase [Bradyrhizobium sp. CCBAU 21359]
MKITIWHNILWSRYKAVVLSAVWRQARDKGVTATFYQVAETDLNRIGLSPVDLSWHTYPYRLLFQGAYSAIPKLELYRTLAKEVWIDQSDVTILCGYDRPEVWLQAFILRLRGRRFALFCDSTIHDRPQRFLTGLAKRIIFNLADGLFCYGRRTVEYVNHYGVSSSRSFDRCQAAALPRNYSAEDALSKRQRNAPSESAPPRYLYVGRLSPEKSLDHLLRAFKLTLGQRPSASLVLVGKGQSEQDLRDLADGLNITSNVVFAGPKYDTELFDEYSKASCLILPSQSEPWGLVVNEALSYGCPTIASNRCGCVPELVCDGETGFVFEWGNIEELATKMTAVPDVFSHTTTTAKACIRQIEQYTPESAAGSILLGCETICSAA